MNKVPVRRVSRMLTPEQCTKLHNFLKNFSNDTDVTQQKFISKLVIQYKTWIHNFESESEQQSTMQWNEQIGQNFHFITLRNFIFPCQIQTSDDC